MNALTAETAEQPAAVQEVYADLSLAQQQLQAMREEYETTVEELHAANEELQSTNEEYRSTLEELETSKEELQSINEELHTVNQELKSKVEESVQAHNDLQNLFAATEIGTLFLDREMRIKRYTPYAAELFNLMPPDQGRPISHLRGTLRYEELEADAQSVLKTLMPTEREVKGEDGQWYKVNVRPYRTQSDHIDGVVITFVDITANKENERALRDAKEYAESLVYTIPDALLVLQTDLHVRIANNSFCEIFQMRREETEGHLIYNLGNGQWDIPALHTLLQEIRHENSFITGYEIDHVFAGIGRRVLLVNSRRLDYIQSILLTITDISERKQAEEALRQARESLEVALEAANMGTWDLDLTTNRAQTSLRYNQIFGYTEAVSEWGPEILRAHILPEDWSKLEESYAHALANSDFELEVRVRWPDGSVRWIYDRGRVYYEDGIPVRMAGMTQDITARKESEEALRQIKESLEERVEVRTRQVRTLVTQLSMSEQAERHRISQILHDDLQQRLYGLQYQLTIARNALGIEAQEDALHTLDEIESGLDEAILLTRSLSVDLSPPVLQGEGLIEAIGWLASQMERQHGLTVHLQALEGLPTPHADLRVLLFQTVRELLFNIVKHAGSSEAFVTLNVVGDQIQIEVTDRGGGFEVEEALTNPDRHQGLWQIQRRLELVGGNMEIESFLDSGTRIVLTCPLLREDR